MSKIGDEEVSLAVWNPASIQRTSHTKSNDYILFF